LERIYRDEGISAHTDRLDKRPGLVHLLADAERSLFDVVLVHTLDRWARNLSVALQAINRLSRAKAALISIAENIDYSTGQGRLNFAILASFSEFFSDNLAGHVRKARRERYELGMHNGHPPFAYTYCSCPDRTVKGHIAKCPGVQVVPEEAVALAAAAGKYAIGETTLAQAASELNQQGFRTRHGKAFTSSSVRFLFSNPYLVGRVRFRNYQTRQWEERDGAQPAILPLPVFRQIADAKGQRERVARPVRRPYVLGQIATCVHCGSVLWSETLRNGLAYYREQRTRQVDCPASGKSVRCDLIDDQAAEVFGSIVLPADWRAEITRRVADYDRVRSVEQERTILADRLRRLTTAYTLGNVSDEDYTRQQAELKRAISQQRVPEVEEAISAGELLSDLSKLWQGATEVERHELLRGMVSKVYVDLLTKRLVGLTPTPSFWSLFEEVRLTSNKVLLLKPEEVKRRLAEHQAALVVLVETGGN